MRIYEVIDNQLDEAYLAEVDWSKIKKGLATGVISLGLLGLSSLGNAAEITKMSDADVKAYVTQQLKKGNIDKSQITQAVQKVDSVPAKTEPKPEVKKDNLKKVEPTASVKDFKAAGKWVTRNLGATDIDGPSKQVFVLESENEIDLGFPYGKTKLKLFIRLANGKLDDSGSMFLTSKGQFHSGDRDIGYNQGYFAIKIDNETVSKVPYYGSKDASSGTAFFGGTEKWLDAIANSKQIKVQIGFFQGGDHIFTFDSQGLQNALKDYKK